MTDYQLWEKRVMDQPFPASMMADIQKFMTEVHPHLTPGNDYYLEVFATDLFFPLQRPRELATMMNLARTISPEYVMEIGADKGGGVYHWMQCLPTLKEMFAIEIRGTPWEDLVGEGFKDKALWCWEASSYDPKTVAGVKTILGERKLDILFIDGDKASFHKDWELYGPLVRKGGLVFMHDIRDDGPRDCWDRIKREGWKTLEILNITDSEEAMEREKQGIPTSCPHESWLRHWKGQSCGVGVIEL